MQNIVRTVASFTLLLPSHQGLVGDTICGINSASHEETLSLSFGLSKGIEDGLIYSFISHCSYLLPLLS